MKPTARIDRIYATLPTIDCRGLCTDSCGPIGYTRVEGRRLARVTGTLPVVDGDLTCSLLTPDGRCSVYPIRPTICRLWGVVESMPCQWGCKPDPRYLTDAEGYDVLGRIEAIGGPTDLSATPEEMIGWLQRKGGLG